MSENTKRIAIVYFSGSGTTRACAQAVLEGANTATTAASLYEIVGSDIAEGRWSNDAMAAELDQADAIILGTPTYMGGVSAQLKAFMDAMAPRWYTGAWRNKLAAGFTVSAKTSGDKLNCLQGLNVFAMQMGMVWVGLDTAGSLELNPNGAFLGPAATAGTPDMLQDMDLETLRYLGNRVAELAAR